MLVLAHRVADVLHDMIAPDGQRINQEYSNRSFNFTATQHLRIIVAKK